MSSETERAQRRGEAEDSETERMVVLELVDVVRGSHVQTQVPYVAALQHEGE